MTSSTYKENHSPASWEERLENDGDIHFLFHETNGVRQKFWEDKEIKSFFRAELEAIIREGEEMRKITCDCESDPGYHTKECDMTLLGYNEALSDLLDSIKKRL